MTLFESEKDWQQAVVDTASLFGWRHFHAYNMRRSDPGWPDLVLVRPPELIVAELKTERGQVTDAQREWLDDLAACGVEIAVWRPSMFPEVEARLRRPRLASSPG